MQFRKNGVLVNVADDEPVPTTATVDVSGAGISSAAKQDAQTALLTTIDAAVNGTVDVNLVDVNAPIQQMVSGTPTDVSATAPLEVRTQALGDNDKPLVAGTVAHGVADAGNPVKIGGRVMTANPTAEVNNDRSDIVLDKIGRQIIVIGAPRELRKTQRTVIANTTETTIATAVASEYHDLRTLLIANGSTTATDVDIRDDTAGTIIATLSVPAGQTAGFALPQAISQTAQNKNWTAQCVTTPSGGNAHVVVTAGWDVNV
jgi:hypothetical protein